jgi:hypothetical protein
MKYFIVFLLNIIISSSAIGQVITLEKKTLNTPAFGYHVEAVIDARDQRVCIGFVQKGINKNRQMAVMNSVEREILALFQRSYPRNATTKPLTIRLNHLEIYELTTTENEVAGAEVNISFLEKKNDASYIELYNMGTTTEKRTSLDVTKSHDNNITNALDHCCAMFAKRIQEGKTWQRQLVAETPLDSFFMRFPIQQATKPTRGYYMSFEDYRDNLPLTDLEFTIEKKKSQSDQQNNFSFEWQPGIIIDPKTKIWGVCDGERYYIRSSKNTFSRIEQDSQGRLYTMNYTTKDQSGLGSILGGVAGGVVGVVVGTIIEEAINQNNAILERYYLNLHTANTLPESSRKKRKAEAVVYINCDQSKGESLPVSILVGGKSIGVFQSGQAYKVHIPVPAGEMKVCVGDGANKTCETHNLEPFRTKYLEVYFRKGKYSISVLEKDFAKYFLDDVKKNKIKLVEVDW